MRKTRQCLSAFSLVEVTLALGILSFALLAVMGLIPVALRTSRDAMDRGIEMRILQAVQADLLARPYSALPATGSFFFDADGAEVDSGAAGKDAFYEAQFVRTAGTSLPDAQNAPRLTTTILRIENLVNGQTRTNCLHLPDNGY